MMERYGLSPEAVEDLLKIQDFISLDSPAAAKRVIDQLFVAFDHLARWPDTGHSGADLTSKPVLFWPMNSYLIDYTFGRPTGWLKWSRCCMPRATFHRPLKIGKLDVLKETLFLN